MSNRTPGPWEWEYHPDHKDRVIALVESSSPSSHEYEDVLLCSGSEGEAFGYINEDNARLIKAAPDLLEACKEALKAVDDCYAATGHILVAQSSVQRLAIEAAIAKAEGSR